MNRLQYGSLSFEVPCSWQDASTISLVGPQDGDASPSVLLSRDPGGETDMVAYAKTQAQTVAAATADFEQLSQEKRLIAGQNAVVVEQTFVVEQTVRVRQIQAFIRTVTGVLTVTCTHADEHFAEVRKVFDTVLSSLKIQ